MIHFCTYNRDFFYNCCVTINNRTLNRILTMMAMDWKNTDSNVPAVTSNVTLSNYISKFLISFHATAATMYSAIIFIIGFINDEISGEFTRPLIIKMDLPFDSNRWLVYEIVMFSQFLHLLLCACLDGTLNALLIALVSFDTFKNVIALKS